MSPAGVMTRAVITGPQQLEFERLPIPEVGPAQVLVRMRASALCTWEQRTYAGVDQSSYPLAGGHEYSGYVEAIGPAVSVPGLQVGDLVSVSGLPRCGQCYSCRHQTDNLCDTRGFQREPGKAWGPGGLGEYVRAEGYQVFKVGPLATPEEAALTEPLACVIHDMKRHPVRTNDTVVIVGAGIMGLLHLVMARRTPSFVIVSEPEKVRREKALELGASAVIDPTTEDYVARVKELSNGRGANVTYVTIGAPPAIEAAVAATAKRGAVSLYASIHPKTATITLNPNAFHDREIVLSGSLAQERDDFLASSELIGRREIDLRPLITKVLPLSKLADAFDVAIRKDAYRVLVVPDAEHDGSGAGSRGTPAR